MNLTLFDVTPHPRWRHTDPHTSRQAARTVTPGAPQQILAALTSPMTACDLERALPLLRRDTLRSALARLHKTGRVREAGTGISDAGRLMTRWEITP